MARRSSPSRCSAAGDDDTPPVQVPDDSKDGRLATLYPFVAASGGFMVLWVFGPFPGSWLTGVAEHDAFVKTLCESLHFDALFG